MIFLGGHKGRTSNRVNRNGRAPTIRKIGMGEMMRAQKKASGELIDLFFNREAVPVKTNTVLAGGIINICARNGVPLEWVKENFLRRFSDKRTVIEIERRMDFLLRRTKPKTTKAGH